MQQIDMLVNELPAPTWNRLKMNNSKLQASVPTSVCEPKVSLTGNVSIHKSTDDNPNDNCLECEKYGSCANKAYSMTGVPTGMGQDMQNLGEADVWHIVAGEGKSKVVITLTYEDGMSAYNRFEVHAQAKSDINLIFTYISNSSAKGQAAVQTKIVAGKNAKVTLQQVQLLGNGFTVLNDVGTYLNNSARFESVQLQLGANQIYNGVRTELKGVESSVDNAIAYYGRAGQRIDMNFIANHYGKKTTSNMIADGVLQDGAFKVYRGTIDFKNGCAGSTGDEKETVLLLTDDVVNQSIPIILCDEEDVQGNHGASIGKMDEDLLFYLCSRGFAEADAIAMMAKAKVEALCRRIDDEETVQLVERYLEGVVSDGE